MKKPCVILEVYDESQKILYMRFSLVKQWSIGPKWVKWPNSLNSFNFFLLESILKAKRNGYKYFLPDSSKPSQLKWNTWARLLLLRDVFDLSLHMGVQEYLPDVNGLILDWPKNINSLMGNNNYQIFYTSNRLAEMQDENGSNAEASVQRNLKKQIFWRFLETPNPEEYLECSISLKLLKKLL